MASDRGVPILNNESQMATIKAGLKGGPFYQGAKPYPSLRFVDGYGQETKSMLQSGDMVNGMSIDNPWYSRRK